MSVTPGSDAISLSGPSSMTDALFSQRFLNEIRQRCDGFRVRTIGFAQSKPFQEFAAKLGIRFDDRGDIAVEVFRRFLDCRRAMVAYGSARLHAYEKLPCSCVAASCSPIEP